MHHMTGLIFDGAVPHKPCSARLLAAIFAHPDFGPMSFVIYWRMGKMRSNSLTAARILRLNQDMRDSPLMDAVRRFHALSMASKLPYCIIGGMAVIRNGYPRTTVDVDILTYKKEWQQLLPLYGDISSKGAEGCIDNRTGVTIDILFRDDDWQMVMDMPDPRESGQYDEELGAIFMGLHELVQLKTAVYFDKLRSRGEDVASKDRSDVYELIRRNLSQFSRKVIETYDPAVRKHCLNAFQAAVRAAKGEGK